MQYTVSIAVLALVAASASAQLAGIPACAEAPALSIFAGTSCGGNFTCICEDTGILQTLESAVEKACTQSSELTSALAAASSLCRSFSVQISIPPLTNATATGSATMTTSLALGPGPVKTTASPTNATVVVTTTSGSSTITSTSVMTGSSSTSGSSGGSSGSSTASGSSTSSTAGSAAPAVLKDSFVVAAGLLAVAAFAL